MESSAQGVGSKNRSASGTRAFAARRFEISPASAVRWHGTFVQEGRTHAKPMGGDQRSHTIEAQADLIRQTDKAQPELFLHELRDRLTEQGLRVGASSLSRFFKRHGITRKKNSGHAAEQEREDVKAARLSWFERQPDLDPDKLVFLDETATNTKRIRRYTCRPSPPTSTRSILRQAQDEIAFAKLRAILRAEAARTISDLWDTIRQAFRHFTPAECRRYLAAAGYDAYDPK